MDYDGQNNKLVAATFARGIQSFSLDQIGVGLETGVKETTSIWAVTPTLVKDKIELKGNFPNVIDIWNIQGNRVGHYQNESSIDLAHLKTGIYFVKGGAATFKIVKI